MTFDDPIEIETASPVTASIVWLHGLGADGHDFAGIVPELDLPTGVRFVLPHAPYRKVTLNGGCLMRAWYDILAINPTAPQDADGMRESERQIQALLQQEHARGIPFDRILLAGYSQGGALALHTGLRFPHALGGIIGLSTYLPLHDSVDAETREENRRTPVFLAHGLYDEVVPLPLGQLSRDHLAALGARLEWHSYEMGHAVIDEELADLSGWITARLAGPEGG